MSPLVISLMIGLAGGVIAALCGVGGGIIMVPLFVYFLEMPQKQAVATSLAAIIFTAVLATGKNAVNGFIDWRVALGAGLAGGIVAWFVADLLKHLSNATLTRIFAVLLIGSGIRMLFQK
jgi:uncharacterized membrane protein YfcA